MLFRFLRVGSFAIALLLGSFYTTEIQAQSPFGRPSCSNGSGYGSPVQAYYGNPGYGQQHHGQQHPYGQPGMFQSTGGNYGANYYPSSSYAPPIAYAPQPSMGYMGYGGGYPTPALNVNQSFYPSRNGYDNAPSAHHQAHNHESHHPWHLGHFLFGN